MAGFQHMLSNAMNKVMDFFTEDSSGSSGQEMNEGRIRRRSADSRYMGQPESTGGDRGYYQTPVPPVFPQEEAGYAQQPVMQNHPAQPDNVVPFPGSTQNLSNALRVINARGISDCYSAIAQLRTGDIVVVVLDGIREAAEMRHYVDMLSGACFSLRATITKMSRHGAYLLCPQSFQVFVDAATNQLNSPSNRPMQQPHYTQPAQPVQQGNPYMPPRQTTASYTQQAGYTASQPLQQQYQARQAPGIPLNSANIQKETFNGYMPDPIDAELAQ